MNNKFLRDVFIATVMTLVLLGFGELIFRAFYPEYRGYLFSDNLTYSKYQYIDSVLGGKMRVRTPSSVEPKRGEHIILVFGDSVSRGYGLAYEDIYWTYWQRMLDLKGSHVKVVALSAYGNNYKNNTGGMLDTPQKYREKGIYVDGVIYQFNFNDLYPYTAEDIKAQKNFEQKTGWISNIILKLVDIRLRYLNHSVMQRVLTNKMTQLFYNNTNKPCEDLGSDALADYTYTFIGKGSEQVALNIWQDFEDSLVATKRELGDIPFVVLVSPLMEFVDPNMAVHSLSRQKRFDCVTIDPVQKLRAICEKYGIYFVNPTDYIKGYFDHYRAGQNPQRFYFINDDNHMNDIGSKYFAEYSYMKNFEEEIIE